MVVIAQLRLCAISQPVLYQRAGHDGGLASARAYCCTHMFSCLHMPGAHFAEKYGFSCQSQLGCQNIHSEMTTKIKTTCPCMNQAMIGTIPMCTGCSASSQKEPCSGQSCPEQASYPQAWFRQKGGGWARTWLNTTARPVQWQQAGQVQRSKSPERLRQEQPFG